MKLFFLDFIGSVGTVITFIVFCGSILWAALLYDENKQLRRRSVRSERDIDYEGRYLFVRELLDTEEKKVEELTKRVEEQKKIIDALKDLRVMNKKIEGF